MPLESRKSVSPSAPVAKKEEAGGSAPAKVEAKDAVAEPKADKKAENGDAAADIV
jgi:hypothetical protein